MEQNMLKGKQDISQSISDIISSLNDKNIEKCIVSTLKFFDENFPYSFHFLIYSLIYSYCIRQNGDLRLYFIYLKNLEIKEEEIFKRNYEIINGFKNFLLSLYSNDSHYILYKMYEEKLIDSNFPKNTLYFAHMMTPEEIKENQYSDFDFPHDKFDELKKDEWKLHKQLIEEGHNPNEIAKVIRNDEIEKLQKISSQTDFNFNKAIRPSIYERYTFINNEHDIVSLIDYAAFFGSIKCFKYLLMNDANVINTGKYAIAGGNIEIILLCEQNHSTFENAYEAAIQFHRNNVFLYLYENKINEINNLEELGKKCVEFFEYEIFSFLLKEGMKINDDIINEAAKGGNLFLVRNFIENNQIPKNILAYASSSNNVELVDFITKQNGFDINAKMYIKLF